jgi:hypothetical protein
MDRRVIEIRHGMAALESGVVLHYAAVGAGGTIVVLQGFCKCGGRGGT